MWDDFKKSRWCNVRSKLNYTVHATKKKLHKSSSHQKRNRKKTLEKRSLGFYCSTLLEIWPLPEPRAQNYIKKFSISTIRKLQGIKRCSSCKLPLSTFYSLRETSKKFSDIIVVQMWDVPYHKCGKSFSATAEKKVN